MATIEEAATIDLRVYVAESTLLAEGLSRALFAMMVKSGAVRGLYSGFRLFVAKDAAREWLTQNAPEEPLPKSLGKRKRVLSKLYTRSAGFQRPTDAVASAWSSNASEGPSTRRAVAASELPARDKEGVLAPAQAKAARVGRSAATRKKARNAGNAGKTGKTGGLKETKKAKDVKATPPSGRPTDALLRKLHSRLRSASTAEERKAIHEECGCHPVALSRWFRMLGLGKIGAAMGAPKRRPDRRRKTAKAMKRTRSGRGTGLSHEARKMATDLLAALLEE